MYNKQQQIDRLRDANQELTDKLINLFTFLRLNYPEVRRAYYASLIEEGKIDENFLVD